MCVVILSRSREVYTYIQCPVVVVLCGGKCEKLYIYLWIKEELCVPHRVYITRTGARCSADDAAATPRVIYIRADNTREKKET